MFRLPQIIPDFEHAKILVIGDIMLDRYWFGDVQRISPEAPVPIAKIKSNDVRPGGAGNVALNIAALGAKVTLLGMIGEDEAGKHLCAQLSAANVHHDLCCSQDIITIVKLRVISRHQQLIRLDFEEKLTHPDPQDLITRYQNNLKDVDLVILSDYQKGTLNDPSRLIQIAKAANIPVLVDPKSTDFGIYQHASIITPNLKEFEAIVGVCNSEEEIVQKGRILLKKYDIEALLVTRGENGMTLIEPNAHHHLPAYAREVYDVTGAGDTVIAVLGALVGVKHDLVEAAALANLAASISVGKLGATSVSVPELQAALGNKGPTTSGIVNREQALKAVMEARAQGKKIVFTNGCYDILHAGHVTSLKMAKELGDYLIVAVNADESIKKLKGPNRPINNLEHRMTVLANLGMVDWVVPFSEDTPEDLLRLLKPDLLVKGSDYNEDQIVGAEIVRAYGGEARITRHDITTSSTSIFNKIQELAKEHSS